MDTSTAYHAARNMAAYYQPSGAGFLRLSGADRLDFIQRQSTNDLRSLTRDQVVLTVLTSPTARILDVLCVIDEGETLGLIPLPGRMAETAQFLRSRIFFSDKVTVEDASPVIEQILLVGPQAETTLETLGVQPPQLNGTISTEIDGHPVRLIARQMLGAVNFHLLISPAATETFLSTLHQIGVQPITAETFEILRVESGDPAPATELTAEYTPLEMGLRDMISDSKGCYTGQEIIARQITYDKVTKHLVGLKLDVEVAEGNAILNDGKSIGVVTSVARSPRFGVIALGVVRRPYHKAGSHLTIEGATGSNIAAQVTGLPFE